LHTKDFQNCLDKLKQNLLLLAGAGMQGFAEWQCANMSNRQYYGSSTKNYTKGCFSDAAPKAMEAIDERQQSADKEVSSSFLLNNDRVAIKDLYVRST
jgi:hypothetical protein